MGWGISIKDIEVRRIKKEKIEDEIEICKSSLDMMHDQIIAYVSATPREIKLEEGTFSWEEYVLNEVRNILKEYQSESYRIGLLEHAKAFPDDVEEWG